MTRVKLTGHKSAQCQVLLHDDGTIDLISYVTRVCTIDPQGWLTCAGTYSPTTRKHIGLFMREYGNGASYYTAKACYEKHQTYNIRTDEVKPL